MSSGILLPSKCDKIFQHALIKDLTTSGVLRTDELICSGAPSRVKRAWDRAPYSWNMVNLFSFGCQVTDRAYVRVYRLYG